MSLKTQPQTQPPAQPQVEAAPLIRLRGVTKSYTGEGRTVHALHEIALDVPPGQFLAIVGRSGCGKSTLLNLLGGIDKPSAGTLQVAGLDLPTLNESQLTDYRRFTTGIIFQFFNLLPLLTVLENAALPALLAGKNRRQSLARARELLEGVGLGERMNQQASLLSGGEMQRVAVARALINDPPLVLADEPTGNLDSKSAEPVLHALSELAHDRERTIVMVTHSREAAAIADLSREMRDGRFVE
ncbi:MAG TPA: ABC transporter ATP-binding protein [Abditibacteriaceae bacterium]|nr:ABC transporter ATP-binding protein [Abditibacteriaceae bacterium]